MSIVNFSELDKSRINTTKANVDSNSSMLDGIVSEIIDPYCKDLDNYVKFISQCLMGGENPPTDMELEDFCINLSTLIYFAGTMSERLGIRDDISRILYRETYNKSRNAQETGTISDKDSIAELSSQYEQVVNIAYNRAWKTMKAKVENAQELLSSCKKVLSRRMQEFSLTHIQGA